MPLFERPKAGERAALVHVDFRSSKSTADLSEFIELVISAGAVLVTTVRTSRSSPDPRFFIGVGKVATLETALCENDVEVVLVNHELSPAQERNLHLLF